MCKFLSGITLENTDVKISDQTDSHREILSEFKIIDDCKKTESEKIIPPSFCSWDYEPPIKNEKYDYEAPWGEWTFRIDDNFPKPEWWSGKHETATIKSAQKALGKYIVKFDIEKIDFRCVILGGTVESICGGTVEYIYGGTVKSICGGTSTFFIKTELMPTNNGIIIDKSGSNIVFITSKNRLEDK